MHVKKTIEWKKFASSGTQTRGLEPASPVWIAAVLPLTQQLKTITMSQ